MEATLKECLDKHGSDKAWRHHYHLVYDPIFASMREQPFALLEVGVWEGASLKAWREFFPNALVSGMDIYKRHPMKPIAGVTQIVGDSTHPPDVGPFDVIIDDACHYPLVQAQTLSALWPMLSPGGIYFLEDVWKPDPKHPWTQKHNAGYQSMNFAELDRAVASTGGKVTIHDHRKMSGELDSCVYEIRKD